MNTLLERRLWWIACLALVFLYVASTPARWQCEGVDEIEYLGVAHSLAHGEGYRLAGEPYSYYPPVVPVAWSIVLRANPAGWKWMYVLNALAGACAMIFAANWMRKDFGPSGRAAGWLMLGSYYAWSFSTRYLMSEPIFLLASMIALCCAMRALRPNGRTAGWLLGAAACVLLSAMTRSGAVTLTAALTLAGLVHAVRVNRRQGILLACAAALAGGGFFVYWELRAAIVNPHAQESYFRWAARFLGFSTAGSDIVARNPGEGVTESTSTWLGRLGHLARESGEFLASVTRAPANFQALALFLALLVALGLIAHLRRNKSSPLPLYAAISMLVFSSTTWVSSYSRYLFVVGPVIYLFAVEGAGVLSDAEGRLRRSARLLLALCGLAGLALSYRRGVEWDMSSAASAYASALYVACAGIYSAMLAAAAWPKGARVPDRWRTAVFAATVCALYLNSGLVAEQRWRLVRNDQSLHAKNMDGLLRCGDWLRAESERDAAIVSSLPKLATVVADRSSLPLASVDLSRFNGYVLLSGRLIDIPAFRLSEEARLQEAASKAGWVTVFSSGDAKVLNRRAP